MYEYTDNASFDTLFDYQYSLINRPMKLYEFYKILTPISAKVGCGHTAVWMPFSYWQIGADNLFPLRIKFINDDIVVTGTYNDSLHIPYGSRIHRINDRFIGEIINEIRTNYSADAFNVNFINAQIERRFPLIYSRRFGFYENYKVSYSTPIMSAARTAMLSPADNQSVRKVVFENFDHPELEFDLIEDKSTAVMTIKTFSYYDRVEYFKDYVDSCFNIIHESKIKNLILDLRGNDGGDPFCSVPLFSYLEPKPLPYYAEPYGKYSEFADPIPLAEKHFTGNLYTLIDGRCFSTNGHFCSLLDYHNIGKFVGTPSGSSYKCNAGKNAHFTLINTGIMLYIGRSTFAAAVEGMDKTKPVEPDYPVEFTYDDFLKRKDVVMDKALDLIEKTKD